MGRRQTYERPDVLRAATALFQAQGFHGVSVEDIISDTGLNRFAIYEKFGGKEGLFYDTLDFYLDVIIRQQLLGPLCQDNVSLDVVLDRLRIMQHINQDGSRRSGCLIVNANIELGGTDPRVTAAVESLVSAFRAALTHALRCSERRGELAPGRSVPERAEHLVTQIQAFFALAYISRATAAALMASLIEDVAGWRAFQNACSGSGR